jgi:hypothetical protein
MDFPILSDYAVPLVDDWEETLSVDPTIRSPVEAGYVQTRAKFTRIPKKWHIFYPLILDTDKVSLESFQDTVKVGADKFYWINDKDLVTYEVRLLSPMVFNIHPQSSIYWTATFDLEQV